MIRAYFSQFIGTGSLADPFRKVLTELIPVVERYVCDGRANRSAGAGLAFVLADVTPAQHATLLADARITYLPFEDAGGAPLRPRALLNTISTANRLTLRNIAEAEHIPLHDLNGVSTVGDAWHRIAWRFALRGWLGQALDWIEGLNTLVRDMVPARRQTIAERLRRAGFDLSVVDPDDTLREAIRKLLRQAGRLCQPIRIALE